MKPARRTGRLLLVVAMLAWSGLAAPASAAVLEDEPVAAGCVASIVAPWMPYAERTYRIAVAASGRTCAAANVTLTIRNTSGTTLLTFASAAADLPLVFAEATTPAAMMAALRRWIEQPAGGRTTRDLPAWSANEDEPMAGDLVFHPEPAISRIRYGELRKSGLPAFCFLQGSESEACYALDLKTDTLTLIGTQMLAG